MQPEKEEMVQLQNSLGVLTLYQDLRIGTREMRQYELHEGSHYFAVPQKQFVKRNIFDSISTNFAEDVLIDLASVDETKQYFLNPNY